MYASLFINNRMLFGSSDIYTKLLDIQVFLFKKKDFYKEQ